MMLKATAAVLAGTLAIASTTVPASAQHWRHGHHHHHHRHGGWGPGIAGFAAGALIGGALAAQSRPYYAPGYYAPPPSYGVVDADDVAYCQSRYRSYDVRSGTYLGYDGQRHPCP